MSTVHSKNKNDNNIVKSPNIKSSDVTNTWINSVIKEKEFNITELIDTGFVRAYLSILLPESTKEITVTVWKEDYIECRLLPWMKFEHENVMPLLYLENIPDLNAVLSYTIPGKCNLQEKINSQEFKNYQNALSEIITSVMEITNGLNYIHKMGFAHLNLKAKTVTVLNDDTLKIDNFQFLKPTNISELGNSTTRNGLPQSLYPPESFYDQENAHKYLKQFDSWAVGIMIIEMCTGEYLKKKLPKSVDSWCLEVYPILYKILKKKKFEKRFKKCYPESRHGINLRAMRILAADILTLHPCNRPTVSDISKRLSNLIKEKDFITNTEMYKKKPKIWKRKMHWSKLMIETARLSEEAKRGFDDKVESVDQATLDRSGNTENMSSGKIHEKDNVAQDHYTALRGEIIKYYGAKSLEVSEYGNNESVKIFPKSERSISIKNKKGFVRKKEFVRTENDTADFKVKVEEGFVREKEIIRKEKECADCSTKLDENNSNAITCTWSSNIFPKLIGFADFTLKYVTDPWAPENSSTYLNKLSQRLTG